MDARRSRRSFWMWVGPSLCTAGSLEGEFSVAGSDLRCLKAGGEMDGKAGERTQKTNRWKGDRTPHQDEFGRRRTADAAIDSPHSPPGEQPAIVAVVDAEHGQQPPDGRRLALSSVEQIQTVPTLASCGALRRAGHEPSLPTTTPDEILLAALLMSHDSNSNTWTEPPWTGWIETTGDALLILEAARRGLIPRVTRRLVDSERKMITSGSVFVFDEDESGIKRWTDGFFWSPSRILGNFLLYRETEKRGAGHRSARAEQPVVPQAQDTEQYSPDGVKPEGQTLSRPKSEAHRLAGADRQRERSLVGSLTNSYKFKPGGMMKKTFSLTIGGVAQHLISYYKIEDVEQGRLRAPSTLPELAALDISPEYLDKTHFRNPPKVEIGVDGVPRYRGEADDSDASPTLLPSPLGGSSLYTDPVESSSSKRGKRYDPYGGSAPKRSRKGKNAAATTSPESPTDEGPPPPLPVGMHQPQPAYPGSETAAVAPHYAPYSYYPGYPLPPMYPSGPYPAMSPTPPHQSTPSPPHGPPPPPPQYVGYPDPSTYAGAPVYSAYYPPPPPHGYAGYPTGVPWPHYGYPPPPPPPGHGAGTESEGEMEGDTGQDVGA
ncbi:uncharacterized protein FIBRA_04843 [Fibroporia radiculosa]|uniref:Uncharacterized protein n=1 Tax=Fibroporia radiculosa TaxID=599839 RepID=J4IAD8_9APHY|nr:uncharacterized protein FIBRA_04843 [Fibroporia radiculosa]CCM02736.1 predicted protein [Fibroporia radiculosa]